MKKESDKNLTWKIIEIRDEVPAVKTLVLLPQGEKPTFIAGQYLTVLLPGFEPAEGKSYSIASIPHDTHVCITVKSMGSFSDALVSYTCGDSIQTTSPYGFFYPDDISTDLTFIAGGVGIVPCMSIIRNLMTTGYAGNCTLLYSNRTLESIIYKKQIDTLVSTYRNFHSYYFLTRELCTNDGCISGRISSDFIADRLTDHRTHNYFICGSIDFTRDMWKMLKSIDIENSQIYTEGFF